MKIQAIVLASFTKQNSGGNRAGVVLGDFTDARKLSAAKQLGFSETAFVTGSERADFGLTYFTTTEEVPLCGHATIAAFSYLLQSGRITPGRFTIETKAGLLHIFVSEDGKIMMEQTVPAYGEKLQPEALAGCFGVSSEVFAGPLPIQVVSTGLRDILLPVRSTQELLSLQPDRDAIITLCEHVDAIGIHAFALTGEEEPYAVCRNFAPRVGISEESATGTSNCALACYLQRYVGDRSDFLFEQGISMGQASCIYAEATERGALVGGYAFLLEERALEV